MAYKRWRWLAAMGFCFLASAAPVFGQSARERAEQEKKAAEDAEKAREQKRAETKALRAKVAQALKFEVIAPSEAIPARRASSTRFKFDVKVTNPSDVPAVVSPFLTLKIVDSEGNEFRAATRSEKHRPITSKEKKNRTCRLDDVKFLTVPAGKSRLIPITLAHYDYDPKFNIGYKFTEAGTYELQFTYVFLHDKFLAMCLLENCENHDGEEKAWNSVHEMTRKFSGKLRIAN